MIILQKNGRYMAVATDLQASAFERNGYVRVEEKTAEVPEVKAPEPVELVATEPVAEKRKGGRPKKTT